MRNIALVGCAHIHTPGFVKRLQGRTDVKVVAVWDHDGARARTFAAELGAPARPDLQTIWNDDRIDAAIICSETERHEALIAPALKAGLHLFVEKPLGLGAADAARMATAIADAGVIFQTGYFQRGLPAHLFIRDQIRAGAFGRISRLRIANCHSGSMRDLFSPDWLWMTDRRQAGVGGFGDMGAHALDLMLWLLGRATRVTATVRTVTGRYGEDCDETGEALLELENGVIGSIAAGWADVANPVTLELSGTAGHALVRNRSEVFVTSEALGTDGRTPWVDLPEPWPHALELFLDAINGKNVPLVGPHEAAERNTVMSAMYEAARSSTWVQLSNQ